MTDQAAFDTHDLSEQYDTLAPDSSEIRLLGATPRGSMAHGTLQPGQTSFASRHRTVEEIWFVLSGRAAIWRRRDGVEEIVEVGAGNSLTIPLGADFQFRTIGDEPYRFIMCTMPPWPGPDEAIAVEGRWPSTDR